MASKEGNAAVAGIYKITSPSGRVYVGQSWNIYRRWRHHRNDRRSDGLLQRSLRKYGISEHVFEIIFPLPRDTDAATINEAEQFFIGLFTECGISMLNLTEGGRNARMSAEQKEKIRQALRRYKRTPEHRANISKSKKGVPKLESFKQGLREKMKGRPATWLRGKKLSPEHIEKIRLTSTGRKHTEEFKRALSERNRARISGKGRAKTWADLT